MAQTLKFLGRGSAFNVREGNTSAYMISDNKFYLFDCGESIAQTLIANNKLKNIIEKENITDINVCITHLHSDHVGSLSSLIYYCYYALDIKLNLYYPKIDRYTYGYTSRIIELLSIQGNKVGVHYEFKLDGFDFVYTVQNLHDESLDSYSYNIQLDNNRIFYSGDCKEVPYRELNKINNGDYDEAYLECSLFFNPVHMSLEYLDRVIDKDVRDNVYLMHIDNHKLFIRAKELGFKIVELDS